MAELVGCGAQGRPAGSMGEMVLQKMRGDPIEADGGDVRTTRSSTYERIRAFMHGLVRWSASAAFPVLAFI